MSKVEAQTDLQDVGRCVVVLVEQEPLAHSGDAVVGELLGDEVAGHALQRLQGQLARVVHGHAVARKPQLELERDLEEQKININRTVLVKEISD